MSTPGEIGAAHRMGAPPLTPDEMRSLLRECVTVVKPGETLVWRTSADWTPNQCQYAQESLNAGWDEGDPVWPFRILVLPGGELGVVESSGG